MPGFATINEDVSGVVIEFLGTCPTLVDLALTNKAWFDTVAEHDVWVEERKRKLYYNTVYSKISTAFFSNGISKMTLCLSQNRFLKLATFVSGHLFDGGVEWPTAPKKRNSLGGLFSGMGNFIGNFFRKTNDARSELPVIVLNGFDGAGKTTFMFQLWLNFKWVDDKDQSFMAITQFPMERAVWREVSHEFLSWDVGTGWKMDLIEQEFFPRVKVIMYMVNGIGDYHQTPCRDKIDELYQFKKLLTEPMLEGLPVMILINKSDLERCRSTAYWIETLNVVELCRGRKWCIVKTSLHEKKLRKESVDEVLELLRAVVM